jgi:hypothetical protein
MVGRPLVTISREVAKYFGCMHNIRVDRINKLVDVRLTGTLDVAAMEASGVAARAAVRSLGLGPGAHVALYDISEGGVIDDAAIASALQQWADPRYTCVRGRKVAVVAAALNRLKVAGPTAVRDNMAIFATRDEAMRWLFA